MHLLGLQRLYKILYENNILFDPYSNPEGLVRQVPLLIIFLFFFWFPACGILFPWPGLEPARLQCKHRVLTTGPTGKSTITPILQMELLRFTEVRRFVQGRRTKLGCCFFFLIYLFLASLGLRCCTPAFSSCCKGGYSSLRCVGFPLRWLLLLQSTGSRCAGFSSCGTEAQ